MGKFDVITSFAFFDGVMKEPIEKALKSHIENGNINLIHIVTESEVHAIIDNFKYANDKKVCVVKNATRPTFQTLIGYSNTLLTNNSADVTAIINGDVSFSDELAVKKSMDLFAQERFPANGMLALSRHEVINGKLEMYLKRDNSLPNYVSADAWVFNKPCVLKQDAFYFMGQMNCDLMLASDLIDSGYQPLNPCLDIVIIHHEGELKSDEYYDGENEKKVL